MDDFSQFHPVFQMALRRIFASLQSQGWQPKVASGMRTTAQQAEKVRHGYSRTMLSWHVRSTMAILPLTKGTYDVVNGNAADIIDIRYGWNGAAKDQTFKFWTDLGRAARACGCEWGGDWSSFPDVAHVQMLYVEEAPRSSAFA